MMQHTLKKLRILFALAAIVLPVGTTLAATISVTASHTADRNQTITVSLVIDSGNQEINAIEGVLDFTPNTLTPLSIRDNNSIINAWVERPSITEDKQIKFSGIIPGGYSGKDGKIFDVVFTTNAGGEGIITPRISHVLLNDGKATEAKISETGATVSISAVLATTTQQAVDTIPPEAFLPILTRDDNVFDGKWFLVFNTQDKGSGMNHYEVREDRGVGGVWRNAESPYLLEDQALGSNIRVRAIDNSGNFVESRIPAKNKVGAGNILTPNYILYIIFGIIVIVIMAKVLKRARKNTQ